MVTQAFRVSKNMKSRKLGIWLPAARLPCVSVHAQSCRTENRLGTVCPPCFTIDTGWCVGNTGWGGEETGGTHGTPAMLCSMVQLQFPLVEEEHSGSVNKCEVLWASMATPHYLKQLYNIK